jgi:hypothetical protein
MLYVVTYINLYKYIIYRWLHCCPLGCCPEGAQQSTQRLVEILSLLFINRTPSTPALNKWTQLYPSLSWWCVATHLHSFLPSVWARVFVSSKEDASNLDLLAPAADEVLSALHQVRAGKVRRWLFHHMTRWELLIICITLRAVLSFMGFLFKRESTSALQSVTVLLQRPGVGDRVVSFLVTRLLQLESEFWCVYRYGGMDEHKLQLALDTVLRLAGSLSFRVMYALEQYPWRLWRVVDPAEPYESRREQAAKVEGACQRCFDPYFTKPLLATCTVQELLDPATLPHKRARASFQSCRATNIMSELRFARTTKHLATSKVGRACSLSTVASKHLLSELSSLHNQALDSWESRHPRPHIDVAAKSSKAGSSWHHFVAERRKAGVTIKEAAAQWGRFTEGEKAAYAQQGGEGRHRQGHDQLNLDDLAMHDSQTPLGIGNEIYPVREDVVQPLCEGDAVFHGKRKWREMTGKTVAEPAQPPRLADPADPMCGELYGPGQCGSRLAAAVKERCDALRGALRRAARALGKSGSVPLLCLRRSGGEAGAPGQAGHMYFMVCFSLFRDPEAYPPYGYYGYCL